MIPKIIHYCWFGRNPLPKDAKKCINSWRKYMPDYEIKEWNEDNFDINICQYTLEAYKAKKYAFVSDYARFWILYHFGGIYFDTDVEVIKSLNDIISAGPFMGIEKSMATKTNGKNGWIGVNAGLGLGAVAKMKIYKEVLDFYDARSYLTETSTVVTNVTKLLALHHGLKNKNEIQEIEGIRIYPTDYFCPMDSTTGMLSIKSETVSIHHYSCSWIDHSTLSFRLHLLKNKLIRLIGPLPIMFLSKLIKR